MPEKPTNYIKAIKEIFAFILALGAACQLYISKPPIELLSEQEGFVISLPWIMIAIALVVHFSAIKPDLTKEFVAVGKSANTARFIYTSFALVFTMLVFKGCSDSTKLFKCEQKEKRENLSFYSVSCIDSNALQAVRLLEIYKGNSWQLGDVAQKYTTKKWDGLAIYFFEQAEACENNISQDPSWRQYRPKYIISLFRIGRDQDAAKQIDKLLMDIEVALSNQNPKLAAAIIDGKNWNPYTKDRIDELEMEFYDQTREFQKKLDSILAKKTQ